MCRSAAEGGQRCAAHTRPRFEAATLGTEEWDEAAKDYCATRQGEKVVHALSLDAWRRADADTEAACITAIRRGHALRAAANATRNQINGTLAPDGNREWFISGVKRGDDPKPYALTEEHNLNSDGQDAGNIVQVTAKEDPEGTHFGVLLNSGELAVIREGEESFNKMRQFIRTSGQYRHGKVVRFNVQIDESATT